MKRKTKLEIPFFVGVAFIIVVGLWVFWNPFPLLLGKEANRFDALSALFTGLAFVGLLWTLHYQIKELNETRDVLSATAQANEKTAKMAIINTRVQFLFFFLKENKDRYKELCEVKLKHNEPDLIQTTELTRAITKNELATMHDPKFEDVPIMSEQKRLGREIFYLMHQPFLDQYQKFQEDLEELTGEKLDQLLMDKPEQQLADQ